MEFEKIMGESVALQAEIKTKETEVAQLKKEIETLSLGFKKPKVKKLIKKINA